MSKRRLLTVSNALTMLRFALVPVFAWAAVQTTVLAGFCAIGVFLLASFTDAWDGRLARSRNEITDFGKIADPIADKALTGAAFVILSMQGLFPWWATSIVLVREWGITIWRLRLIRRVVHAANGGGKVKTTLQLFGIALALWPSEAPLGAVIQPIGVGLVWVAAVVTVWTGVRYAQELLRA